MPTPASIALALAMERKLISRWCYQYSGPCRDTPKPLLYGKSASTRSSISCKLHTCEDFTEVRSTGRSSFYADKSTRSLSLDPTLHCYYASRQDQLLYSSSGPPLLNEDNEAAIDIVNANRSTELSRHIDIQHFAIHEWRQHSNIKLAHICGVIRNPAND
jgi:hypothetical protein